MFAPTLPGRWHAVFSGPATDPVQRPHARVDDDLAPIYDVVPLQAGEFNPAAPPPPDRPAGRTVRTGRVRAPRLQRLPSSSSSGELATMTGRPSPRQSAMAVYADQIRTCTYLQRPVEDERLRPRDPWKTEVSSSQVRVHDPRVISPGGPPCDLTGSSEHRSVVPTTPTCRILR
jgi:hypothetical protein